MMNRIVCVSLGVTATAMSILFIRQIQLRQMIQKINHHDAEIMDMIRDETNNRIHTICVDRKT
ncbi:MAG: hypothetical protein NC548_05915 [Lachnospiraceae bacterium]|nr:hypothetical protein [Lachnospiraceae bacterium]